MIRIPGVCNFDASTVVLAHFRMPGDGMGRKPHDSRGAYACSACHNFVDGRDVAPGFMEGEIELCFAQGVFRTQDILIKKGLMVLK